MAWITHLDPALHRAISAMGGAAVKRETHQRRGRAACAILYRCDCGRVVRGPSAFQHAVACSSDAHLERCGSVDFGGCRADGTADVA